MSRMELTVYFTFRDDTAPKEVATFPTGGKQNIGYPHWLMNNRRQLERIHRNYIHRGIGLSVVHHG